MSESPKEPGQPGNDPVGPPPIPTPAELGIAETDAASETVAAPEAAAEPTASEAIAAESAASDQDFPEPPTPYWTPTELPYGQAPTASPYGPAPTVPPEPAPPAAPYGAAPTAPYGAPIAPPPYGAPATPPPYGTPAAPPPYGTPPAPAAEARNALGLTAMIVGIVSIVLAAIPFLAFIAWLPALFAIGLGIAALVSKRSRRKGQGITGLVLGALALVLAVIMSVVTVILVTSGALNAIDDSVGSYDLDDSYDDEAFDDGAVVDLEIAGGSATGDRSDPFPIGETVEVTDVGEPYYSITVGTPDLDADDTVAAENEFNETAPDGSSYVLLPVTVEYHGDADDPGETGSPWEDVYISFETADAEVIDEEFAVIPEPYFDLPDLQPGESATGNMAFILPDDAIESGTWLVTVGWEVEYHVAAR